MLLVRVEDTCCALSKRAKTIRNENCFSFAGGRKKMKSFPIFGRACGVVVLKVPSPLYMRNTTKNPQMIFISSLLQLLLRGTVVYDGSLHPLCRHFTWCSASEKMTWWWGLPLGRIHRFEWALIGSWIFKLLQKWLNCRRSRLSHVFQVKKGFRVLGWHGCLSSFITHVLLLDLLNSWLPFSRYGNALDCVFLRYEVLILLPIRHKSRHPSRPPLPLAWQMMLGGGCKMERVGMHKLPSLII